MKRPNGEPNRSVEILLVEDNPGDTLLVRVCLERSTVPFRIHAVKDGYEAMSFLQRQGPFASESRPDLILLDLNLPGKDGREVLGEVKTDPRLRAIPVVILTSSRDDADVADCYAKHANCYIAKPIDLESFDATMKSIESFWLTTACLPHGG